MPTHFQAQAPAFLPDNPNLIIQDPNRKPLIDFLLRDFKIKDQTEHKFLILGNAGMGKTTFMINFISKLYREKINRPIKIIDLGDPGANEELDIFLKQPSEVLSKSVLLLDAYDEYTDIAFEIEALEKALIKILDNIWRVKHLVITCRINFFPNEFLEKGKFIDKQKKTLFKLKGEKRMHQLTALYVSPFSKKEIQQYLSKKYGWYNILKIKKANEIILNSHDLMSRPLLLSYIDDLMGKEYEYTFQQYETIIDKWIEREANKPRIDFDFSEEGDFRSQLYSFTEGIALNMYQNEAKRKGFFIPIKEIEEQKFWKKLQLNFKNESRKISKREAALKGLLVHDTIENRLRFAHRSILEYFIAKAVIDKKVSLDEFDVIKLNTGVKFLIEMIFELQIWEIIKDNHSKTKKQKVFNNRFNHEAIETSFNSIGVAYYRKNSYDLSIENYKKAIGINPKEAHFYNNLGDAYYELELYDSSIENIKKAIGINPKKALYYNNLGRAYHGKESYGLSIENFKKAIKLNPNDASYYNTLGWTYLTKDDLLEAKNILTQALSISSKSEHEYTTKNLGHYWLIKKETQKALEFYKKSKSSFKDKKIFFKKMNKNFEELNSLEKRISQELIEEVIKELEKE
ncbi:MAG: tetratricopeptide repeat protein [Saprospiraceae bacterium]